MPVIAFFFEMDKMSQKESNLANFRPTIIAQQFQIRKQFKMKTEST